MSGGLHRLWKQALIDWINPRPGMRLVDVAGGTGDVTFRFLEHLDNSSDDDTANRRQYVTPTAPCSRSPKRRRSIKAMCAVLILSKRQQKTYPLRTVPRMFVQSRLASEMLLIASAGLAEMHRILDFGGHFFCLEFSPAVAPILAPLYETYSNRILPWLGEHVAGDREAYEYLVESIRRFPEPGALTAEMKAAGSVISSTV